MKRADDEAGHSATEREGFHAGISASTAGVGEATAPPLATIPVFQYDGDDDDENADEHAQAHGDVTALRDEFMRLMRVRAL